MFSVISSATAKKLRPAPLPPSLPTQIRSLDRILPYGGLPSGRLTQLSGHRCSGKRTLAAAICAQVLKEQFAVWIDGRGSFYPLFSLEHAQPLNRLLVVRPPKVDTQRSKGKRELHPVLKAADILMRAGPAASMIVIDLPPRIEISLPQLARLRLHAQTSGTTLLIISEDLNSQSQDSLGTFVALHLRVQRQVGRHQNTTRSPTTRTIEVQIAKSKLGRMAQQTRVALDAPHQLHLDTTL